MGHNCVTANTKGLVREKFANEIQSDLNCATWLIFQELWVALLLKTAHLPLDKMAAILQTTFSNDFSWMKKFCISILISLRFVPKAPIDNKSTLVQVMAWHLFGAKPLSEPVPNQFTYAYVQH